MSVFFIVCTHTLLVLHSWHAICPGPQLCVPRCSSATTHLDATLAWRNPALDIDCCQQVGRDREWQEGQTARASEWICGVFVFLSGQRPCDQLSQSRSPTTHNHTPFTVENQA
jgi:hypothetical protein